jgi:Cd2+/Zn2+-exporting ATPase
VSGTLLVFGSVRIKTLSVGKDTTLEKIIALIEQAESEKSRVQTLGEKFGKLYLSSVFIVSFVLYLYTQNLLLVLSVVLVVCADDVAVAIPLAYLKAVGSAARKGIVIKGGRHLETLGKVEALVFDKTGTITTGVLHVSDVETTNGFTKDEIIRYASILGTRSTHPLAKAIVTHAKTLGFKDEYPETADVIEGMGIVGVYMGKHLHLGREIFMKESGNVLSEEMSHKARGLQDTGASVTFLSCDGVVVGVFALEDTVKKNAKEMIERVQALGVKKIIMLSGDNEKAVAKVALLIGVSDYHANLLPADKLNTLRALHKKYIVAMVGDGVNDAAALAISHVGIAMGALGSDAAIESAEIVLMHDNLLAIPQAIELARDTHRIALQDFGIWVVTNVFGLGLVFGGLIGPSGAALYNFISDFFPLINSVRVKVK